MRDVATHILQDLSAAMIDLAALLRLHGKYKLSVFEWTLY